MHAVAICGIDVDEDASSSSAPFIERTLVKAVTGVPVLLWSGIALLEPRLYGTPNMADRVLGARLARARLRGVASSSVETPCAKVGCSGKW